MRTLLTLPIAALAGLLACRTPAGTGPTAPPGASMQRITVTSRAFTANGPIPVDNTCDGADRSPGLTFSAAPQGTKSLAVIVDDPDAPGGDFIHWVAYNLPADASSLPEAVDVAELGGVSGLNGFGRPGYNGPCPPKMELHGYHFRVYALDATLSARANVTAEELQAVMNGHVLAVGVLVGTFSH